MDWDGSALGVWSMVDLWSCWKLHRLGASIKWDVMKVCSFGLDSMGLCEHLLLIRRLPPMLVRAWSGALRADFDFVPSSLGFAEGLEEAFIAYSNWTYDCAQERASLILATLCFMRCFHNGWVTYSLLMNASADTSSPQLKTLVSWFWKKLI